MVSLFECAEQLNIDLSLSEEMLSYSERERLKICIKLTKGENITIDASVFDAETLSKIITYLKEKNVKFLVINS